MIIDFHTHVGKIVNSSVEDLLRSMDKAKIDHSVIISGDDVVGLNRHELMDILDMYPHTKKSPELGDFLVITFSILFRSPSGLLKQDPSNAGNLPAGAPIFD
jgi:hypothetical protein